MAVLDKMAITLLDKLAVTSKCPCSLQSVSLQGKALSQQRAHDKIIDAVACAMAPNTRDEIAEAVL